MPFPEERRSEVLGRVKAFKHTEPVVGRRVVELFAGVGGLRLGLDAFGWQVVWSNQWEPSTRVQHASDCYVRHFGPEGHSNQDISTVSADDVPEHDLLVGGFPCQDYSVAKTLSHAAGIRGKKGVLWWEIERMIRHHRPRFLFLENVDRLLKSPASQRGRDFAVMLACLVELGYLVEWRVVNAADYGFPQRRRRVFIVAERLDLRSGPMGDPGELLTSEGYLARSLPVQADPGSEHLFGADFSLDGDLVEISERFGGGKVSPFQNAGVVAEGGKVWTRTLRPAYDGPFSVLADVLQPDDEVGERFYVRPDQVPTWRYLKGAKREERMHLASGTRYFYTEGAIPFPDQVDRPSRTILTGEGGSSPSRFKHIIAAADGRYRRLTPVELERLDGFPDGWTDTGMPDARRAFMTGNALVVGVVERIGAAISGSVDRVPAVTGASGSRRSPG